MDFSHLLVPGAIRIASSVSSKKRLFQELGELAATAHGIDATQACEALRLRESLGPTGVGKGIALPHARLEGLHTVMGVFLMLDKPIDFDAVDNQPVDIAFALFAPLDPGADHLKALALVSRTLREPLVCTKLRANRDPATLFSILNEAQVVKAA